MTELTAGEQVAGPHLDLVDLHVEAGRDAAALVQTTVQLHNDLSRAVVVDHGDLTNVTCTLHDSTNPTLLLHALKELQEHLRARADQDLTLTALLSVGNGLKSVGKDVHQHGCLQSGERCVASMLQIHREQGTLRTLVAKEKMDGSEESGSWEQEA